MESEHPSLSSPSEYERLQAQIDALNARLTALESARPRTTVGVPVTRSPEIQEQRLGLTLVNRIGAITLALGVVFFFKYAADNNWIGPGTRILLGVAAGGALLWFGDSLHRREQRVLAQGITACGLAILYAAAYASAGYYKLILDWASALGMVLVSGLTLALAVRRKQPALAAFGFTAADLTLLLWQKLFSPFGDGLWIFAVGVGAVLLAVRYRWVILAPIASILVLISAPLLPIRQGSIAVTLMLFAAVNWAASRQVNKPEELKDALYVCGHALLAIGFLCLESLWIRETSVALTVASVGLVLYGTALLALGVARASLVNRGIGLTMIGLVVGKLYLYDIWNLNYGLRITAFVALGILLLAASFVYSRWRSS